MHPHEGSTVHILRKNLTDVPKEIPTVEVREYFGGSYNGLGL